jgi:hypothetical protein
MHFRPEKVLDNYYSGRPSVFVHIVKEMRRNKELWTNQDARKELCGHILTLNFAYVWIVPVLRIWIPLNCSVHLKFNTRDLVMEINLDSVCKVRSIIV